MRILLNALCALPALGVIWFTWGWYVEAPLIDQLYLLDFFTRVGDGSVEIEDWFARHEINGHHIFVPRIILTILAFATGWTMRAETWLSLTLAVLSFVFMARLARDRVTEGLNATVEVANLLMAFSLFSLSQYWNWLWGFSVLLFLVHIFFISAVLLLTSATSFDLRRRLGLAAGCCALASFCMIHGILTWVALVPSVVAAGLQARRLRETVAIWSGSLLITLVPFLYGIPHQSSRFMTLLEFEPLRIPIHFFNILGIPTAMFAKWMFREIHETEVFWPVGLALFVAFTALSARFLWRAAPEVRARAIPWISIGLFSIGYAGANTLGRADIAHTVPVGLGLYTAIYATPPVLLTVAVIQLMMLWVDTRLPARSGRDMRRRVAITLAIVPFGVFSVLNTSWALRTMLPLREKSAAYADSRCFEFARYLAGKRNTCVIKWFWTPERLDALESLGFRNFHKDLAFDSTPRSSHGRVEGIRTIDSGRSIPESTVLVHGFVDLRDWQAVELRSPAERPRNDVIVTGTVRLPGTEHRPTTVLLSPAGAKRFIAWAEIDQKPTADAAGDGGYAWRAAIPDSLLTGKPVHAWVYDPTREAVVQLDGKVTLRR